MSVDVERFMKMMTLYLVLAKLKSITRLEIIIELKLEQAFCWLRVDNYQCLIFKMMNCRRSYLFDFYTFEV